MKSLTWSKVNMKKIDNGKSLFCPKCGDKDRHDIVFKQLGTKAVGVAIGAKLGSGMGIAMLGTAFGALLTVPVLCAAGYYVGKELVKPKCKKCGTRFSG